jgi:hypothetical protein
MNSCFSVLDVTEQLDVPGMYSKDDNNNGGELLYGTVGPLL